MAATRYESLKHLMTDVLELTEHDKPWRLVHHHHKCNTLLAFDRLTEAQLCETFRWDPAKGTQLQDGVLDTPEVDELMDIQEWIRHNKFSLTADWVAKKPEDFALFTQGLIQGPAGIIVPATATGAAAAANPAPPVAITSLTAYGLKRDFKDYPEITQRHFFLPWADNVMTTAIMHNSSNPLDTNYVPVTDLEKAIFRLENTFMFAVFLKTVKYSSGKTIVAEHKKAMDGQAVYKALTEEATGTAVRQINEAKCQEMLKDMECSPNKWSGTLESFIDVWLLRKQALNDVRMTTLPDDEAITWFTFSVKEQPVLLAAIQHQESLKSAFLRSFPGKTFVQTLSHFIDDIRLVCVQYDNVHKKTVKWTGPKDKENATRRANAAHAAKAGSEADQVKKEAYEKYKEQLKAAGLWIEPDTYNSWTPAQKKAHSEKVKAKRVGKKARSASAPVATLAPVPELPPPTPPSPPPPYATMAAGHSAANPPQVITMFGRTYRAAACIYKATGSPQFEGSLIDGGCNGGLAGSDVLILETHPFGKVNIIGVGDNVIANVPLCTAAGLIQTSEGPVIAIMHNYAALGKGGSIHSPLQLKDHGIIIDDTPKSQKRFDGEFGTQMVRIATGSASYDIPLVLNGGLPYLKMCAPTQEQLNDESIPHVLLTSDMPWEPSKYDENHDAALLHPSVPLAPEDGGSRADTMAVLFSEMERVRDFNDDTTYDDEFSELHDSDVSESKDAERNSHFSLYNTIPNVIASFASVCSVGYEANKTYLEHKYGKTLEEFRPNFGFLPPDRIKATIEASTQFFRAHQWSKKIKSMKRCLRIRPTWK
jgi:ribosomal protein L14E/L6E/L27E